MNNPAGIPALKQKPLVTPLPAPTIGSGKLLNPHSPPFTPRLFSFSSADSPSASLSSASLSTVSLSDFEYSSAELYSVAEEVSLADAADLSELVLWYAFIECDIHHLYFEPIVEIDSELSVLSISQRKKIVDHLLAGISKYQLTDDGTRCWRVLQCLKDLCF